MIAETMAGIALVKGAVDGIKSIINTANDVSDIASYVDKLFEGEKQVQQKRNSKSGVDSFGGIGGVASEVIDARLAKEKMQEVATLIDMRFGHGTWKSIVDERARRLQEEKAKAMEARRIQIQKAKEIEELFQTILLVIAIVVVVIIAAVVAINII
jgi:hypothetical protein